MSLKLKAKVRNFMGFIGSLLNSDQGAGFQATKAPVIDPVTGQDISAANQGAANTAAQQAAFANAVGAQNGLGNQAAAYGQQAGFANQLAGQNGIGNQSAALQAQQQLQGQLAGQGGVGNQSSVFNQQQGLANQYQNVANGTGPNPALAQLNQTTGNNIASQAALMAGQRGAGANVGLLARQAGQQGAGIQQQAVGQAATLGAQQQLAGMQGLQNQQAMLGNTAQQQIANQSAQNQAVAGLSSQQIAQQQQAMAQQQALAGQQVGQQQNALNAATSGAQGVQGNVLGAVQGVNNANVGAQGNVNNNNATIASGNQKFQGQVVGGAVNALSGALGLAEGGEVNSPAVANIPMIDNKPSSLPSPTPSPYASSTMQYFMTGEHKAAPSPQPVPPMMAHGGKVPAMLSPGERYLPPQEVKKVAEGKEDPMKAGKKVPGTPKVKGAKDSYKNDTVKADLEAGGIVIPRHVTEGKNPGEEAAKFVMATLAKKQKRLPGRKS